MSISCLKTLALNILQNCTPEAIASGIEIPELDSCSICYEEIFLSLIKKPFTALPCGHIFHRTCLENSITNGIEICPARDCSKSFESELQDVEVSEVRSFSSQDAMKDPSDDNRSQNKESGIPETSTTSTLPSKRVNKSTTVDKSSSKKVKKQVKDEDSRILKRLIQELITDIPRISEVKEREALQRESIRGSENKIFFDLYLKISNAEKQNDNARHELIRSYYYFGEELEKRLTQYKDLPEHEAQKKINNEVRDQLPKEISKPTIRKKTERARKVYDLFFRINDDKNQRMVYIQRIKTFTASSISNLSLDNIKYVASQVRKDTGT